jgi:nicotinamide-nucleotide amidase
VVEKIQTLAKLLTDGNLKISVAESCTGGALASTLTGISGASNYFDRAYITYSNKAKVDMLGVNPQTISVDGVVSETVAAEMVKGVLIHSDSDIVVAITGIAGPTGGTKEKPIGTVCFGFCVKSGLSTSTQFFKGSREEVVNQSVEFALHHLILSL